MHPVAEPRPIEVQKDFAPRKIEVERFEVLGKDAILIF
jgi:hypothetical protein